MRAISLATATALGLLLAPAAAYRLALPVSAAAQPPRAACSTAGRAARASSIDMIGGNNLDGTGSFRTVQEYPCDLDVKIIGANEGPFVDDMVTLCAERTGQKEEDISAPARCRRRSGSGRADRPRRHGSRRPRACARGCPLGTRAELQPLWSLSEARPKTLVTLLRVRIQVRDGATKASTARSRCGCTLRTRTRCTTCTPRSIATRA